MGVYKNTALAKARAVTTKYRGKLESGVGQAKTAFEIAEGPTERPDFRRTSADRRAKRWQAFLLSCSSRVHLGL